MARVDSLIPGLAVARDYDRSWLRGDITAGLVLTALLIPAGIGYAQVAGLPAITGIYATIVPLLVYAAVGPSRILVLGPDSALAPIIAASVLPLALGDPDRAVALAGVLAILVGAFLIIGSVARLGFVTDLLSRPIRVGYLNGIAIVVIASQLPTLLGVTVAGSGVWSDLSGTVRGLIDGEIIWQAMVLGIGSLAVVLGPRLLGRGVVGVGGSVVIAMIVVAMLDWETVVPVVGELPRGLPAPSLGGLSWGDVASLIGPALGIALIAFTDAAVLSRAYAARLGDSVSGTDEMRALGIANVATGVTGGFPMTSSSSRTPVAEQAGARTQLAGVVGALALVVFVVAVPGLTATLPRATLAAVVIPAAVSLIDVRTVLDLLRTDRIEGLISIAAVVGVVVFGVLQGIVVAIALSLVAFVNQAWRPYRAELGRLAGVRGYHDLSRHPEGERIPGVLILRFDAPLFFANAGMFDDYVRAMVRRSEREGRQVHTVILAAEPITDVDSTAIEELVELDDHLTGHGIDLILAEMKGPAKDQLSRYGLGDRFGPDCFAPTVGAAVDRIIGRERDDIGSPSDRMPGDDADEDERADDDDDDEAGREVRDDAADGEASEDR